MTNQNFDPEWYRPSDLCKRPAERGVPKIGDEGYSGFYNYLYGAVADPTHRLSTFDAGTGNGKSYTLRQLIESMLRSPEEYNRFEHIIYLTPLKNGVDEQYNELLKEEDLRPFLLRILTNDDMWQDEKGYARPLKKHSNSIGDDLVGIFDKTGLFGANRKGKARTLKEAASIARNAAESDDRFYMETAKNKTREGDGIVVSCLKEYVKRLQVRSKNNESLTPEQEKYRKYLEEFIENDNRLKELYEIKNDPPEEDPEGEPVIPGASDIDKWIREREELNRYKAVLSVMQDDENMLEFLQLFTNILILAKKVLFMTTKKAFYSFSTYIPGPRQSLFNSSVLLDNSLIIMDESDAQYQDLLDCICRDTAGRNFDLASVVEKLIIGFRDSKKKFPDSFEGSEKIIQEALDKTRDLIPENYHLGHAMQFASITDTENESSNWMCIPRNEDQIISSNNSWYIGYCEKDNVNYLVPIIDSDTKDAESIHSFEKEKGLSLETGVKYTTFVMHLTKALNIFRGAVLKLAKAEKASENDVNEYELMTQEKKIMSVLAFLGISDTARNGGSGEQNALATLIETYSGKIYSDTNNNDSFFMIYTKKEDDLNLRIRAYYVSRTPENIIEQMLKSGAHVMFVSATAGLRSPLCNFDIPRIEEECGAIHEPENEQIDEAVSYSQSRIEYVNKLDVNDDIIAEDKDKDELYNECAESWMNAAGETPDEQKIHEILKRIEEKSTSGDSNQYRGHQLLSLCSDIARKIKLGCRMSLMVLSFKCDLYKEDFDELFEAADLEDKYVCRYASSGNLKDEKKVIQKYLNEGKSVFLISAYQSLEQGIDLKFKIDACDQSLVALNDGAKKRLENARENKDKVLVDFDGFYLGRLRTSGISLENDSEIPGESGDEIEKILRALIIIRSAGRVGYIRKAQEEEMIKAAMKGSRFPLKVLERDDLESYKRILIPDLLRRIIQLTGRINRSDIKFRTCDVRISEENKKVLYGENIKDFFQDEGSLAIKTMHPIIKRCMAALFSEEEVRELSDKEESRASYVCRASDEVERLFNGVFYGKRDSVENRIRYEALSKTLLKPIINGVDQDYLNGMIKNMLQNDNYGREDDLDPETILSVKDWRKMYFRVKKLDFGGSRNTSDGYFAEIYSGKNGVTKARNVWPKWDDVPVCKREFTRSISKKQIIVPPNMKDKLEEAGFSFSWDISGSDPYILTPEGFALYKGAIGEFIGHYYMSSYLYTPEGELLNPEALPYECAELMDQYQKITMQDGRQYILAVDYKNYQHGDTAARYDDRKKMETLYREKMDSIALYFNCPVLGIELNTGAGNWEKYKKMSDKRIFELECGQYCRFVTVSYIYTKDGKFNDEVRRQLNGIIDAPWR